MLHDVFISYSSKDAEAGLAVCAALERRGVRCWMAPRDIVPGEGWARSILGAIGRSRAMVLLLTDSANHSQQVEREVERAVNRRLPIIPMRIENVMPGEALEYFLSAPHWLDAFTPPLDQHLDRLADAVQSLLNTKFAETSTDGVGQPEDDPRPVDAPPKEEQAFPSPMADLAGLTDNPDVAMVRENPEALLETGGPPRAAFPKSLSEESGTVLASGLLADDLDTAPKPARQRTLIMVAALTSVAAIIAIFAAAIWTGLVLFAGAKPPV
jgi:hypothetical protein